MTHIVGNKSGISVDVSTDLKDQIFEKIDDLSRVLHHAMFNINAINESLSGYYTDKIKEHDQALSELKTFCSSNKEVSPIINQMNLQDDKIASAVNEIHEIKDVVSQNVVEFQSKISELHDLILKEVKILEAKLEILSDKSEKSFDDAMLAMKTHALEKKSAPVQHDNQSEQPNYALILSIVNLIAVIGCLGYLIFK